MDLTLAVYWNWKYFTDQARPLSLSSTSFKPFYSSFPASSSNSTTLVNFINQSKTPPIFKSNHNGFRRCLGR